MHHVLAYNSLLLAQAGFQQVGAVPDPYVPRQNSGLEYQIPEPWGIYGAFAGGAANVRAKVTTPTLILRGPPQIVPFEGTQLPPQNPNFMDMTAAPIILKPEETLRADMESNSNTNVLVAVWIANPKDVDHQIKNPDLRWVRGTVAITTVANVWAGPGPIVFDDPLEGGLYDVYGLQAFFATCLLARLVFPGQVKRPGCLGQAAAARRSAPFFMGGMGLWGQFDSFALPQLEVMDTASAAVSYTIWVLMSKAGSGFAPRQG